MSRGSMEYPALVSLFGSIKSIFVSFLAVEFKHTPSNKLIAINETKQLNEISKPFYTRK